MKAIFAVTALAAAISTQALAADTETSVSYLGVMDVYVSHDFESEYTAVSIYDDAEDDDDDAGMGLEMEIAVTNGPFSANITTSVADGGDTDVSIGDIILTHGKITAGQVGSLMSTDEYTADMQAINTLDELVGVEAGIRYMIAEGLNVQVQGTQVPDQDTGTTGPFDYGIAAQYAGSADALSYVVEGEIQMIDDQTATVYDEDTDTYLTGTVSDVDAFTFFGAGVTYTADSFEILAAINVTSADVYFGGDNTEFGISASGDAAGFSWSAAYTEYDTDEDDNELIELFAGYAVSETLTAGIGYDYDTVQDSGDVVYGSLAYAEGMITAEVEIGMEELDADDSSLYVDAEVVYTDEAGVEFYGEYDWQDDETGEAANVITAGIRYAF